MKTREALDKELRDTISLWEQLEAAGPKVSKEIKDHYRDKVATLCDELDGLAERGMRNDIVKAILSYV